MEEGFFSGTLEKRQKQEEKLRCLFSCQGEYELCGRNRQFTQGRLWNSPVWKQNVIM